MNTVGASYRVFMAFLIVFLLSSATNVNANSATQTRINILNESEPQRDFYSGSWLASNGSNKVEAFFWKQNHHSP